MTGSTQPAMKMPELPVFARSLAVGFIGAEVARAAFCVGAPLARELSQAGFSVAATVMLGGGAICLTYAFNRDFWAMATRLGRSRRVDLLFALGVGIWANILATPSLSKAHEFLTKADWGWALALLLLLCAVLLSPIFQRYFFRRAESASQLYFMADDEIQDDENDFLDSGADAKSFAEAVLESGAHPGLIFGVEGPWGVGKTSFVNLAARHWLRAENRVIVCRFEPLRYASEPDLADRLIRELTAAIQRQVFAPEFRPAASRYSRLIKGKADVSFFGMKISLEPTPETADDLLEDIDDALKRIGRRVIIVIDDLDRLDPRTTNNVLFATRRTFKLSQATYVLCYDTEILASNMEEGAKAREFLEKFVTVKLSLFVDSSKIRDFLRHDWQRENRVVAIPSDTMLKLGAVLNQLADALDGELAANYLPLVGDLRKVKRFVNALLLMQLEKTDLGRTDFNKLDLINLILIHLNYPGIFRRIYAEETEGRVGTFSVRREFGERSFKNAHGFKELVDSSPPTAAFLLRQLFDAEVLQLDATGYIDEKILVSRACFNHDSTRNLEKYLKLIVRFATPEPRETFILYQEAVNQVRNGTPTSKVLEQTELSLTLGEGPHDQFWRILVNQSHDLPKPAAQDAIDTLVEYLPRYSSLDNGGRGLRQRSMYSLLRLLDRAGWGPASGRRSHNTDQQVLEIAWRVFGTHVYKGKSLISQLASEDRGILGWNDLMLFRLQCSADRQGQLYNVQRALILDQDEKAATTGVVSTLAVLEMRKISQAVFAAFRQTYIDQKRNFFSEVNNTVDAKFVGEAASATGLTQLDSSATASHVNSLATRVAIARSNVRGFVIYQLSNTLPPQGSGVGCGYYDESGDEDGGGIANRMNEYVFDTCFNPDVDEENALHFLDYCLSNLSHSFFEDDDISDEDRFFASRTGLPGGLAQREMGRYWSRHRELILAKAERYKDRHVLTANYVASYGGDLAKVFLVLDEMANLSSANNDGSDADSAT